MTDPNNAALEFMATRRSYPLDALKAPGPDQAQTTRLLQLASRVPDHGALTPWRFLVPGPKQMAALAQRAEAHAAKRADPEKSAKAVRQFTKSPRLVVVIGAPVQHATIPEIEQTLTAGAVCLGLVNAALASGWGAVWLTNWLAHDRAFAEPSFNLAPTEWVAGLIHIGSCATRPPERPRPDVAAVTTWSE